jgi:hypothetical protein
MPVQSEKNRVLSKNDLKNRWTSFLRTKFIAWHHPQKELHKFDSIQSITEPISQKILIDSIRS